MNSRAFFMLCSFWSLNAFAAPAYNSAPYWANHFALRMAKIKEPQDILLNLTFSARHRSELEKEVASNTISIPAVTYKVYLSQVYMIDANKKKTVIDFKSFKFKKLYLNNKPIYLKPDKAFSDLEVEVAKILNPKKKISLMDIFVNSAQAQSDSQSGEGAYARLVAALFTSASSPRYQNSNVSDRFITSTLIATYENEAELARTLAPRDEPISVTSLNFMCEGNVLTQVVEYPMVTRGRPGVTRSNARRLVNNPMGGYDFLYGQPGAIDFSCSSRVDDNGLVTAVNGNRQELCPKKGLNIFNDPSYFGGFPRAASMCCRKKGCYEEVRSKVIKLRESLLGVPQGLETSDTVTKNPAPKNNEEAASEVIEEASFSEEESADGLDDFEDEEDEEDEEDDNFVE